VFVASRKFEGAREALSHFPRLEQHLRSAVATDQPRGAITISRRLHRVTTGNVALLGDASGSVDAVTGEGLGLCFRQALALAEALKAGNLAPYQQAHQAIQRLPRFMARAMLLLDRSPSLRHHTLGLLQRYPGIFQRLLEIHVGEPLLSFSRRTVSSAQEYAWPLIEQPIDQDL
jgi:flavin-dependent dehydrogenase